MYDEELARDVRDALRALHCADDDVVEKPMTGGMCFLVRGNVCCSVMSKDRGGYLMCQVGESRHKDYTTRPGVTETDNAGRCMRGFVYVSPAEVRRTPGNLKSMVRDCVEFNKELPRSTSRERPSSAIPHSRPKSARASTARKAWTTAKSRASTSSDVVKKLRPKTAPAKRATPKK